MKRLIPCLLMFCAQIANARVIDVSDHGVTPGKDVTYLVNQLIEAAQDEPDVTLVFPKADATHFVGCRGTIRLEHCLFEHMLDDGINVHGAYVKVDEYIGQRQFIGSISHPQQWGLSFAEPGDKVALLSRETVLPFFETTVKEVKVLNEERFCITLASVPDPMPTGPVSIENLTWYPDLVMKHNIIRENRARSVLVTTKGKVWIEDNVFSSQMNGILIVGDNNKWYESGAVQDVT